jgi:outer membrane protein assembly factor BamD (BamD/ComL family)
MNEFTQRQDQTGFFSENFETILENLLNGNVNQAIEQIQALERPYMFFCELETFELNTDSAEDGRLKFRLLHGLCANLLSKL